MLISTKLRANQHSNGAVSLHAKIDGVLTPVANFRDINYFYIVSGFRSAEAYNAAQDEKPITFLQTVRRAH